MVLHLLAAVLLFWNAAAWDFRENASPAAENSPKQYCLASQDFSPEFPALEAPAIQLTPYVSFSRNRDYLIASSATISGLFKGNPVYPAVGWQSQAALQSNGLREWQMLFPFHFFL